MSLFGFLKELFIELATGKAGEIPSIADIVPTGSIKGSGTSELTIDFRVLNIPFTKPPIVWGVVDIPNTNSMDGAYDAGNNAHLIQPADTENQKIMVGWIADQWLSTEGKLTADCIYRVPADLTIPAALYRFHRLVKVGFDDKGRYFKFKGIRTALVDPVRVRDNEILYLGGGVTY